MTGRNTAASIRALLHNKARAEQLDFNWLLLRYALERLLYRLSVSAHRDNFLLKGALLFDLWFDAPLRPTRDIDLLGFGVSEVAELISAFEEICHIPCNDGMLFDISTLKAEEIRAEANYSGLRVTLVAELDGAKSRVQVDVGYGDAVTPAPELATYPVILPVLDAPALRVYPRYTVVAEKLEAIVTLGMANSRLKDYFDLWIILNDRPLDDALLREAFEKTLQSRGTNNPRTIPAGLSKGFSEDLQKVRQWQAFITKNKITAPDLVDVVKSLAVRLGFLFATDE